MEIIMAIGLELEKKLKKKFEPSSMISMRYRNFDLAIKTDEEGNAIQLFMGKANAEGIVKGERYTRTLKHDLTGKLIKDHWERKGKAT
jgi:hypothetical protein